MSTVNFIFNQSNIEAETLTFRESLNNFINLINKIMECDKNNIHEIVKITQRKNLGAYAEVIQQVDKFNDIDHSDLGHMMVTTSTSDEDENLIILTITFKNENDTVVIKFYPSILSAKYTKHRHKKLYAYTKIHFSRKSSITYKKGTTISNTATNFRKIFGTNLNTYRKIFSEIISLDKPEVMVNNIIRNK